MIAEVAIAAVAVVTIAGTWMGLRFASKELHPEEARDRREANALAVLRSAVESGSESTDEGRALRALLVTDPEALPPDARARAVAWLNGRDIPMPAGRP